MFTKLLLVSLVLFAFCEEPKKKKSDYIFPGTKWCGKGNKAESYDDLGEADDTDRCCRAHDKAPGGIKPEQTYNNLTNSLSYVIKPCDVDETFYKCLKEVDSYVSNLVGTVFFNILKSKCYAYRRPKACAKRRFYGCTRYRMLENFPEEWRLVDNPHY